MSHPFFNNIGTKVINLFLCIMVQQKENKIFVQQNAEVKSKGQIQGQKGLMAQKPSLFCYGSLFMWGYQI